MIRLDLQVILATMCLQILLITFKLGGVFMHSWLLALLPLEVFLFVVGVMIGYRRWILPALQKLFG